MSPSNYEYLKIKNPENISFFRQKYPNKASLKNKNTAKNPLLLKKIFVMQKSRSTAIQPSIIKKGKYQNIEKTPAMATEASFWKLLKKQFSQPRDVKPAQPIPVIKTNLKGFKPETPSIVWFGHSSYLIQYKGKNLLVDPVFSGHASPFSFMIKAFSGTNVYQPEDMPSLDFHIQSHNHYDHLDKFSVKKLASKTAHYLVPKAVGKDFKHFGIASEKITKLDWGEQVHLSEEIKITATPARHFSGRGLKRNTSLWNSYVLQLGGYKIFIGGDSGYGKHFVEIGKNFGPFDLAILECGQYDKFWPFIHMQPEETLRAAEDLKTKVLLPVHWAKFKLANHSWKAPVECISVASKNSSIILATPKIGQRFSLEHKIPDEKWWKTLD